MKRRNFIKAAGSLIFLPALSSLGQVGSSNSSLSKMVFIGYGFGPTNDWYPDIKQIGKNYKLTPALEPLKAFKNDFSIVSNYSNLNANSVHGSCETFLTGADTSRTRGKAFHNAVSCDHIAAKVLGKDSRYSSLVFTGNGDGCGHGLSMSWDDVGNPIPGYKDPLTIYNNLFGDGTVSKEARLHALNNKQSILDAVVGQIKNVEQKVSKKDKNKLDEYFTGIRNIEVRLNKDIQWIDVPLPKAPIPKPEAKLEGYQRLEIIIDLMVAALQTEQTRVSTLRIGTNDLLKQINKEFGSNMGAHNMSHYGSDDNDPRLKASRERDLRHSKLLARLIAGLKSKKDKDGSSLLDNTVITMGTGVRTKHGLKDLPIIVAGGHNLGLKQGQHVVGQSRKSRLSNLWLTLLQQSGVQVNNFSDSDGLIEGLV